jgi:hypothetical protein
MTAQVDVDEDRVVLQGIECREADVVAFFGDAAPETRVELAGRAVAIGVVGLRAMGVAGHVKLMEREFAKLSHQFDRALATTEGQLLERVHSTFDPDHAESVSARLAASVADAHGAAGKMITETRSHLERLIQDSFNPDLATSCVYRIAKLARRLHDQPRCRLRHRRGSRRVRLRQGGGLVLQTKRTRGLNDCLLAHA